MILLVWIFYWKKYNISIKKY